MHISDELAELINLRKAAEQHRDDCHREDCTVMLRLLFRTANRLLDLVPWSERDKAVEHMEGWPL